MKVINNVTIKNEKEYINNWLSMDKLLKDNGMTWSAGLEPTMESDYTEEEYCQYVTLSLLEYSNNELTEIQKISKQLFNVIQKIVDSFYDMSKESKLKILKELQFSDYYIDLIMHAPKRNLFSYLCRFDFIYDKKNQTYKCIEFNSDTPTGLLETGMVNSVINDYYDSLNPSIVEKQLVNMWNKVRSDYNIENEMIHFSALGDNQEDRLTVEYSQLHGFNKGMTKFTALEDIGVSQDQFVDQDDLPIKNWFKLFPVEYWELEDEIFSKPLKDLIKNDEIKVINPISAFLTQNKLFYALMWSQTYKNIFNLSEDDINIIRKYCLPTYNNKEDIKHIKNYVEKPVFGREGNCVTIFENNQPVFKDVEHEFTAHYENQPMIYQEYIEMPDLTVETWDGSYTGKHLIGSYMIGGEWSGLFNRIGHKITGNLSLVAAYTCKDNYFNKLERKSF